MTLFETDHFQEFPYSKSQTDGYFHNAELDFVRAEKARDPNIAYRIGYESILKLGIAMIADAGYKVKSVPGHHIKILEKLGEILKRPDEIEYLHRIRRKRNIDLYEGGLDFTEKESSDLLVLCGILFVEAKK
ncbi:hypothetical protein HZA41_01630 [Candidatus Peregrinibacteria bacterium]|nr:hypothetical protein [Candidatus Peregrinibacteria bacterium]